MFKNFTWGHGIVAALGSFIIFILSMIFLFSHGQTNSELITDDYYEEELAYQNVIDAKNRADQLAEKPQYLQNANGITVTFPKEYSNANTKVRIDLHRAEDQNLDIKKDIPLNGNNSVFIPGNLLSKGNYILKLQWTKDQKNYQVDYDIIW